MYHVEREVNDRGKRMAERYLERMALKLVTSGFKVGRLSKEQNVRIRYVPCKRINNMNGGSLFYPLELFSLCSSDGIMPDWGTVLEEMADYCNVEMQKLLGRNPRSPELF